MIVLVFFWRWVSWGLGVGVKVWKLVGRLLLMLCRWWLMG